MNKRQIISIIKKENKKRLDEQIKAVSDAIDYLKKHKHKKDKNGIEIYMINNNPCICTYRNLWNGILEFTLLKTEGNLGTEYDGQILRLEF